MPMSDTTTPQQAPSKELQAPQRGLLRGIFDLFSSVTFGIILLVILFLYMSVGSAGLVYPIHPNIFHPDAWVHAQIRQWRPFEMTEFEWFHWWPFDVLIGLLCLALATTTIRRIPFKLVNLGVWMIHTGIITLAVGSIIYFTTKIEGDAPVVRRAITVAVLAPDEDGQPQAVDNARFLAMPGNSTSLGLGAQRYELEVTSIDPAWELLSGDDAGDRAYSVNLLINGPNGRFIRQLIAGYPEYTEDMVFTEDPQQPFQRSVKVNGTKLVDENILIGLDFESADWFYLRNDLAKNWALYVRTMGTGPWIERPIEGDFLYNDYIADRDWVWNPGSGENAIPIDPIDVLVPAVSPDDPAPEVAFNVSGFLRYAVMRSQALPGSERDPLNPVAWIGVSAPSLDRTSEYQLMAFDPERRVADGGLLMMRWIDNEAEFASLVQRPALTFSIPELGITVNEPIAGLNEPDGETFVEISGTKYGYRVVAVQDDLQLSTGPPVSVAIVELQTPLGLFRRWVFDTPLLTRDVIDGNPMPDAGHAGPTIVDDSITVTYNPGMGQSLVTLVAGPDPDRLRLLSAIGLSQPEVYEMEVGTSVRLAGGLDLEVEQYSPRSVIETKPLVVAQQQRVRDAKEFFSRIRVGAQQLLGDPTWLRFHMYPFQDESELLRRHIYAPTTVVLEDGRKLDLMFSRRRAPLPGEIALDEFVLTTHVGGFTGESSTIRDYTSMLRFRDEPTGAWSSPVPVSMNKPVEHQGLWYFQAQWDPPDKAEQSGKPASAGLNYTVLGVGNRHGVYVQLLGCIIAVIGMIYAFYVKPVIKQRARRRVYEAKGNAS